MGGGNAQKTAKSREKHNEKAAATKNAGGGAAGLAVRKGGDMAAAMAEAQAKREMTKKLREEGKNIPQASGKKSG